MLLCKGPSLRAASVLVMLFALGGRGLAGPALSGRVSDETGSPLPGATVTVHKLSGDQYDESAQANGQGQYCFGELPNGVYSVGAVRRGFVSASFSPVRIDFPVGAHWDFTLRVTQMAEGGIYASSELLGELVSGGTRVANARVCLSRSDGSGHPVCTTTNRLGQYFLSVPPGQYEATTDGADGARGKQQLDLSRADKYRDRIVLEGRQ